MTSLILVSFLLNISVPVYSLPEISESSDIIVVMMEDGLLPDEPWDGMTPRQREEFWSYACSGMMIQRAGWVGYIIICPQGIGEEILESAKALASVECIPDNSVLSAGLQLTPVSDCTSSILFFSSSGSDPLPAELPLRSSRWLAGEHDTLMVNSANGGNAFFWTDFPDSIPLSSASWRGTGIEIVPVGNNSVNMAFTCVHGNVPSNLYGIQVESHQFDTQYMRTWGSAISAVDSIIVELYPIRDDSGHLLWIKGNGTGIPRRTSPSPNPPPSAQYRVEMPLQPEAEHPFSDFYAFTIPNAVEIELPGRLSDPQHGPVMESVLARIFSRDVLSEFEDDILFDVQCGITGDVSIWMINADGTTIRDTIRTAVLEDLRNSILVPPGLLMIGNALIRASFLEGTSIDSIGVREVSMELMNLLYPEE